MGLPGFTAPYESGHTTSERFSVTMRSSKENSCSPQDLAYGASTQKAQCAEENHCRHTDTIRMFFSIRCSYKQTECHVSWQGKFGLRARHHPGQVTACLLV